MTSYIQRHVYFNVHEYRPIERFLAEHDAEPFSALMRRLLKEHMAKMEETRCDTTTRT